jgi:hypothetical protein
VDVISSATKKFKKIGMIKFDLQCEIFGRKNEEDEEKKKISSARTVTICSIFCDLPVSSSSWFHLSMLLSLPRRPTSLACQESVWHKTKLSPGGNST